MSRKLMLGIKTTIVILILGVLCFKTIGTGYCYVKTPEDKAKADAVIKFCGAGNLWFREFYSESLAEIYAKYPDKLHNEASASMLLTYYVRNNPSEHLDKIDILVNIITDDVWHKEKRFLFILEGGFLEDNLPLEFRQKVFNKIYERYLIIIPNEKRTDEAIRKISVEDMKFLHKKINQK